MKKCNKCKKIKENKEFHKKRNTCRICYNIARRKHYSKNIDRMRKWNRERCQTEKYREYKKGYDKIYREINKEKFKQCKRNWNHKNKNNIIYKIKKNLRRRIHHVVKDSYKSDNTFNLIGCTAEQFKMHIESQFTEGMTWENYGMGNHKWHIDHIIPCYKFDLSKPEEQKKCFHYTNQRPLWQIDNLSRKRD